MNKCSKCGGSEIHGPVYCQGERWGCPTRQLIGIVPEHLDYRCVVCGYTWTTPTEDAARVELRGAS